MGVIIIFIFITAILGKIIKGDSCEQGQCYCFDNRITCIGTTGPRFRYRVNVNFLYMDQVQILDFDSIFNNLPNLEHLTMMNMRYFKCDWINDIPSGISLHTNMCVTYSSTEIKTEGYMTKTEAYMTSTGEYCAYLIEFKR